MPSTDPTTSAAFDTTVSSNTGDLRLPSGATTAGPDDHHRARVAEARIRAALALLDKFDPTCGAARTRTFVADLHRILDEKP